MRDLTARDGPLGELMRAIEKDEARWCAMLAGHLRMLGQPPSSKLRAFYEKAMAISDLGERIAFLNRGQGWVVRKLRELLPRVRDNSLHADLSEMLRSHEANIALAAERLPGGILLSGGHGRHRLGAVSTRASRYTDWPVASL